MEFSSRKMRNSILTGTGFAFFTLGTVQSLAATETSSFERKQQAWSQLNYYSPTEGFHSKGSYGLHVGIGAVAPTASAEASGSATASENPELHELEQPKPRVFISKGTPWPVDFGASLSILEGKNARQGGAHVQWTLFEDFQLPSIALRASRSMLTNFHEVKNLTTDAVELGMSYSLIRYIIVSVSASEQWETGQTQAKGELLSLTEIDLPEWKTRRTVYSWGISVNPFTPFVQIGVEQSYTSKKAQTSLAKVSFLL